MGIAYNTRIVRDGLVLHLDAANPKSYPGNGDVWKDISGKNNDATNNGAIHTNEGFEFDGSSYMDIPNDLGYVNNVSAFAWFKHLGSPPGNYHIIFGGSQLEISIHTSGVLRTGVVVSSRRVSNHGGGLLDGKWHLVGFTFDGATKSSYIDGNHVGDYSASGNLVYNVPNRRIGRFGSTSTYYLNGALGDAIIYDRAITSEEVEQNFNALRGRYGV